MRTKKEKLALILSAGVGPALMLYKSIVLPLN